jgi:hypothetical protein
VYLDRHDGEEHRDMTAATDRPETANTDAEQDAGNKRLQNTPLVADSNRQQRRRNGGEQAGCGHHETSRAWADGGR